MSRPSVLIVSPIPSHPADQGNAARIQALAGELRRRDVSLDFFYYGMEGLSQPQSEAMTRFWRRFFFMKSEPIDPASFPRCWGLDDWCCEALCRQVAAICQRHRYDAVIVNYVWMSRIFEGLPVPLKILDTHDLFGGRHEVAEAAELEPRWFFTTPAEESRGFARADVVIGIQANESRKIAARHRGRTITIGHPMPAHFLLPSPAAAKPGFSFGYLGSGNPFNVACITALDRLLVGKGVDWALAGSISGRHLDLRSHPYRMGFIDKLSDFYDAVGCVLNPMMGGTGLKIKTIEALAFGRPVIGTVDAFDGIETRHPMHRLRSVEAVAEAMIACRERPDLLKALQAETVRVFARYMADVSAQYDGLAALLHAATRQPAERIAGAA